MSIDTHSPKRVIRAEIRVHALHGGTVIAEEQDHRIVEHPIGAQRLHHSTDARIHARHHGRVAPASLIGNVRELGQLVGGRLERIVLVAGVRRQVREIQEERKVFGVLVDSVNGDVGKQIGGVGADRVVGEAQVRTHVVAAGERPRQVLGRSEL